jgi:translation elongation factor EF-4
MKLWKKQQKGKKRIAERARVDIAPEVFKELLKR